MSGMEHPLTNTGDKNKMCVRQLCTCFALSGSGNGEYIDVAVVALHKAPDKVRACGYSHVKGSQFNVKESRYYAAKHGGET